MHAKPVVPWMGGKRRLAKHILPLIPAHECYVEPFCGAAAILFMKEPSRVEVINDANGELANLYRVIKHHLAEFVSQFRHALVSRQMFEWHKLERPETLTDIQRASRFFYLQKMAFGGRVHGQTFGTATTAPPRLNLLRLEEDLSQAHLRLSRVFVEHLDWADCMTRYDRAHTVFYLDPPYHETAGYGGDFGRAEYESLVERFGQMKGKAILSINDHPEVRSWFAGHWAQQLGLKYSVGGGHKRSDAKELLITNWQASDAQDRLP